MGSSRRGAGNAQRMRESRSSIVRDVIFTVIALGVLGLVVAFVALGERMINREQDHEHSNATH